MYQNELNILTLFFLSISLACMSKECYLIWSFVTTTNVWA